MDARNREVKKNIARVTEEEIRNGCLTTKGRTVQNDKYETKQYLLELPIEKVKPILRMRMHIVDLPCNFGDRDECWLCGRLETIRTEHYLVCPETKLMRECMGIKEEGFDMIENHGLLKLSGFYKLLEQRNLNRKLKCQE